MWILSHKSVFEAGDLASTKPVYSQDAPCWCYCALVLLYFKNTANNHMLCNELFYHEHSCNMTFSRPKYAWNWTLVDPVRLSDLSETQHKHSEEVDKSPLRPTPEGTHKDAGPAEEGWWLHEDVLGFYGTWLHPRGSILVGGTAKMRERCLKWAEMQSIYPSNSGTDLYRLLFQLERTLKSWSTVSCFHASSRRWATFLCF